MQNDLCASKKNITGFLVILVICLLCTSCADLWNSPSDERPLARVGDNYLYEADVMELLSEDLSERDSAYFVTNFINTWAAKQLLLSKARINLREDQLEEFEQLVNDYRTDLYTRAYKEALVLQAQDTAVTTQELQRFYEEQKENFKLKEKIVKLRFIQLPAQFLNKREVTERLQRFEAEDVTYLDSIGVQFKKLNFNDSLWIPVGRVIAEIPPLNPDNEERYLKKSQFFELEDASGVYLTKVMEVLEVNEIAPLSYIEPTIRQVLLNRRKLDYLRRLETEIIDEATKENEFEVFTYED